jgi:hypothetical protein
MEANVICRETFIIDDAACPNCDGLPRLVILALDENVISQLVAFAFPRDRTTESFSHVLSWLRDHGVNPEIDQTRLPCFLFVIFSRKSESGQILVFSAITLHHSPIEVIDQ